MRRRLLIGGAIVAVIVLIVVAVSAFGGGDSDPVRAGGALRGVRSDPADTSTTVRTDGNFTAAEVVGDLLLLTGSEEGGSGEIRAIDASSGDQKWTHDGGTVAVVGSKIFVTDDGRLLELDTKGKEVGKSLSIDDSAIVYAQSGRLLVYETDSSTGSIVDPSTSKYVARDIDTSSCSTNFAYCLRSSYDADRGETEIETVQVSNGKTVGKSVTVAGSTTAYALDDGGFIAQDGSDIERFTRDGKQASRADIGDGSYIAGRNGKHIIVTDDQNRNSLWPTTGDLEQLGGRGPSGTVVSTNEADVVLVSDSDSVEVCKLGTDGFDCGDQVRGSLSGLADDELYVRDGRSLDAYDPDHLDKALWSLRIDDGQTFQALDGKVAITGSNADFTDTTIDVYG